MSGCCNHDVTFDGLSAGYRRRLVAVIAINAAMFVVEVIAGQLSGSQALKADALDFFADSVTYGASLFVIGMSLRVRASVAFAKGISLMAMGLWVLGTTLYRVFYIGVPEAEVMGIIGFLALAANVASVLLLMSYRDGDANVRSV
ncbi:MAG: cation transporter, partial [Bauldia litoralis]